MRIVYLAAGAGRMYCGACARDLALIRALLRRGHDVQTVPLYTPLRADGGAAPVTAPVHFGGVNVFLQQSSALFRRAPAFLDALLDHPALLKWVSRFAIRTDSRQLGPMTVSMLEGADGLQARALEKLVAYLEGVRPDVINVTNTLLSGLAPVLKARLGVPLVYALQGEDLFVEGMPELYRVRARALMRENARAIDLFIAPGERYAARMAGYLHLPPEKMRVIRAGIDVAEFRTDAPRPRDPFTIGYLSTILPAKGLDLLVDAVGRLVNGGQREVRLRVAGRVMQPRYWRQAQGMLAAQRLTARVEYCGEVTFDGKRDFLQRCSVFALPTRQPESRALAALEALAAGRPVVAPRSGIFPEMMALTEGGVLYPAGNAAALAAAIASLQDDPDEADRLGQQGARGVAHAFSADRMAEQTEEAYRTLMEHVSAR